MTRRVFDHTEQLDSVLHALEVRGLDPKLFLYLMTDLARHHDMEDLFRLCADDIPQRPPVESYAQDDA